MSKYIFSGNVHPLDVVAVTGLALLVGIKSAEHTSAHKQLIGRDSLSYFYGQRPSALLSSHYFIDISSLVMLGRKTERIVNTSDNNYPPDIIGFPDSPPSLLDLL